MMTHFIVKGRLTQFNRLKPFFPSGTKFTVGGTFGKMLLLRAGSTSPSTTEVGCDASLGR
jgi:hypothetical protein